MAKKEKIGNVVTRAVFEPFRAVMPKKHVKAAKVNLPKVKLPALKLPKLKLPKFKK